MVAKIGLDLLKPWPMKVLVDHVLDGAAAAAGAGRRGRGAARRRLARRADRPGASPPRSCCSSLGWALGVAAAYANIGFGQRMVYDLAADLFGHLQRLSLRFHSRKSVGDSIRRVTTDCGCVVGDRQGRAAAVRDVALVSLVAMFVVMWRLEPRLTLLSLAVVPWHGRSSCAATCAPMLERSYEQQEAEGRIYDVVERTLSAIPVVQAFGREPSRRSRASRAPPTTPLTGRAGVDRACSLKFKVLMGLAHRAAARPPSSGSGAQQRAGRPADRRRHPRVPRLPRPRSTARSSR